MWFISDKIKVEDSGLLEGFCDCHCHLVPNVDDGVETLEDSLYILEKWDLLGVKEVWMTPHIMEDIPNKPEVLKEIFENVKAYFLGDAKLHLASENMMDNLFLTRLNEGNLLPIGTDGKHLLVETSYYNPPMDMELFFEKIKEKGYTAILAHPERYQYMDMRHYKMWKDKGVLLQLNVPSLVGAYGPEVQWKAEKMLDKGMYDYCGTDTHSIRFAEYFLNSKISKKTVKKLQAITNEL